MTATFNLVDKPWIPCIDTQGVPRVMGLRDALVEAHEVRGLSGDSPLVTAALHRLLLAVLHRVFGPAGYGGWYDLWEAGHFDEAPLTGYLEKWRHRFDLFDTDRPFYQAPDDRVKQKPVNSLMLDLAFGNKATLFDHTLDDEGVTLTPAEGARALVAAQATGLAGLSGLPQKFTDGTCARGVIFLLLGDTLFETLMLNMMRYPINENVMPHYQDDQPAWEMYDPFIPDRSHPRGYLDYLTWQNRRVLLFPEESSAGTVIREMTLAPGLRLGSNVLDPMKHYRMDQKRGPLVQRFNEHRTLWRDSSALFKLWDKSHHPPLTFRWLSELIQEGGSGLDKSQTRRYAALGMANNQARVDFYRSEYCPLPLSYLTEQALVQRLDDALTMAEDVRSHLWGAARALATLLLSPQSDTEGGRQPAPEDLNRLTNQWAVEREYWSRLEVPFRHLLQDLPADVEGTLTDWRRILQRTAWAAFDRVAHDLENDPRRLKAAVRARGQLAAGLAKALPER